MLVRIVICNVALTICIYENFLSSCYTHGITLSKRQNGNIYMGMFTHVWNLFYTSFLHTNVAILHLFCTCFRPVWNMRTVHIFHLFTTCLPPVYHLFSTCLPPVFHLFTTCLPPGGKQVVKRGKSGHFFPPFSTFFPPICHLHATGRGGGGRNF